MRRHGGVRDEHSRRTKKNGGRKGRARLAVLTAVSDGGDGHHGHARAGAYGHSGKTTFKIDDDCLTVQDITVPEPEGQVYVSCRVGDYPHEADQIKRFNLDGTRRRSPPAPHTSAAQADRDPGARRTLLQPDIAVDNSASLNHGKIFVTWPERRHLQPQRRILRADHPADRIDDLQLHLNGLDVGPDGSIYVGSGRPGPGWSRIQPGTPGDRRLYPAISPSAARSSSIATEPRDLAVDSTGAMWVARLATAANTNSTSTRQTSSPTELSLTPVRHRRSPPGATTSGHRPRIGASPGTRRRRPATRCDVDLNTNDLYVDRGDRIEVYSQGTAGEDSVYQTPQPSVPGIAAPNPRRSRRHQEPTTSTPRQWPSGPESSSSGRATSFPTSTPPQPEIRRSRPHRSDRARAGRTGRRPPTSPAAASNTSRRNSPSTGRISEHAFRLARPGLGPPGLQLQRREHRRRQRTLTGLTERAAPTTTGFTANNEKGENVGIDRTVVPAYVLKLQTLPATNSTTDGAMLNGSLDPDGIETEYFFEYGAHRRATG